MSIEKPKDAPSVDAIPSKKEKPEDEQQTERENVCRERFIEDWVMSSELTPEQKVFVAQFIRTQPGAWRQYNGKDFRVVEARVEGDIWNVSFGVYFDDYEAQRLDVAIPLSA